jgi:hypothetical protein
MKTYFNWLLDQIHREDEIGNMARDVMFDKNLPFKKTKQTLLYHMALKHNYDQDVILVMKRAWKEYKIYRTLI